jgi:hypothetical protein
MIKDRNWSMLLEGGNVFKDKKTGEELTQRMIQSGNLEDFKRILPDIPSVQKNAQEIMDMFRAHGERITREEELKAAEKAEKKGKKMKTEEMLMEFISLLIEEEILLEKKERRWRVHFPKTIEKIIKTKLKKKYRGNPGAIYGTATKIMKNMGLKKIVES